MSFCGKLFSFFSVMGCYGSSGNSLSASLALKTLVKELHRSGIEVITFPVWLTALQTCIVLEICNATLWQVASPPQESF